MILGAVGQRIYQLPGQEPQRIYMNAEGRALFRLLSVRLREINPDKLISSGNIGFDLLAAYVAHELKIPYDIYLSHENVDRWWTAIERKYFACVLDGASQVIQVGRGTSSPAKVRRRDQLLIRNSNCLLLFWDERRRTGRTVEVMHHAWKLRIDTENIFRSLSASFQ